jgi:maleate isomerase
MSVILYNDIGLYGWRARIGLLIPSSNTTMEMEFHKAVPEGVSVHTDRMMLPEANTIDDKMESINLMNKEVEKSVIRLASAETSLIIYGCTIGVFTAGAGHDRKLTERIREITKTPFITVSEAVIDAINELGLKTLSIATPYVEEHNILEKKYLEKSVPGVKVIKIKGLNIIGNIPKGRLEPFTAYNLAKKIDDNRSEGIFISCTNWRTFEIIETLERDLEKPVITSNQAALWSALRGTGIREPIEGCGTLLKESL